MTTGVAAERRVKDVADAAIRAGARARATLGFALPASVAYYAFTRGEVSFPGRSSTPGSP